MDGGDCTVIPWLPQDPERLTKEVVNCLALCLRSNGYNADIARQIVDRGFEGCGCEMGFYAPKTSTFKIFLEEGVARGLAVVTYEPCRRHKKRLGSVPRPPESFPISAVYDVEVPIEQFLRVLTFWMPH
jgi:hypothetical protein